MRIRELTNMEFNDFASTFSDKSLYQTAEYAFVMKNQEYETMLLGLVNGDSILAASVLLIEKKYGFNYAYAPRGFLIDYNDFHLLKTFTKEIKRFLRSKDIMAVKLSPMLIRSTYEAKTSITNANPYFEAVYEDLRNFDYYHFGYNYFFESMKPRFEAIVRLNKNKNELFSSFKKGLRTKIRNGEEMGLSIYKGDDKHLDYLYLQTKNKYPRDLQYFKDIYYSFEQKNMVDFYYAKLDTSIYLSKLKKLYDRYDEEAELASQQLLSSSKDKEYLLNMKLKADKILEKYKNELISATKLSKDNPDGIVVASILVIKDKINAFLLMDGYDKRFKSLNAKHMLLWHLMDEYSKDGYKIFNLGGMTDINVNNSKYDGLNTFKLAFNPEVIEYVGDLELITSKTLYFMYRHARPMRRLFTRN